MSAKMVAGLLVGVGILCLSLAFEGCSFAPKRAPDDLCVRDAGIMRCMRLYCRSIGSGRFVDCPEIRAEKKALEAWGHFGRTASE